MRINEISSPMGNFATEKNNANFKGAYLITGTNKEVNKAAKCLNHAKQDYTGISYRTFGSDPLSDKLTSYLFVTTGKDVEVYNNFIKNEEALKQITYKSREFLLDVSDFEDELSVQDFNSYEEFENHQRMSEGLNILQMISKKCKFSKPIHSISAKRMLGAAKEGKFDFKEGKIQR